MVNQGHYILLIIIFYLVLTGCVEGLWNRHPPPAPRNEGMLIGAVSGAAIGATTGQGGAILGGALIGGVSGWTIGCMLQKHYTLIDKLQYNGVQVIIVGDEVKLILPTDRFYRPNSPMLNPQYYWVLNRVADFIMKFEKVDVKVAAYTDSYGSWRRNLALSREQAEAMVEYLQLKGIDARLLYGVGYGTAEPIANNATIIGRQQNRRIVISLRRIVDIVWY